jgi:hypothetical protein
MPGFHKNHRNSSIAPPAFRALISSLSPSQKPATIPIAPPAPSKPTASSNQEPFSFTKNHRNNSHSTTSSVHNPPQAAIKSGGRQPAVDHATSRAMAIRNQFRHRHRRAIKSGGRQPAVGTKRICNGASFSRGASTFAHHGGLTPPALGCMCGCHCRYALRANEYASFPTGGLRPPLLVALAVVTADMRLSLASMPVFPTAGLRQPLLVDGDAMIRRIAVCNGQCTCTRVAMERSELADILLLFARMHVHKSGDGVVVVPVSLALRLANFKRTCTRVRQLHCNYRRKQGQGLRISNTRAQACGNFIAITGEDNAEACEFRFHVHKRVETSLRLPVKTMPRLVNFDSTCTSVWKLHCNYR